MSENKTAYKFKAEMRRLLDLIVNSLYANPDIFLRELISNSSDALNKVRFLKLTNSNVIDPEAELRIDIEVSESDGSFSISDTGIGMTKKDLINKLGTVASSGAAEFLSKLKGKGEEIQKELIGKFGVGFYSAFMVTDQITVETLYAAKGSRGYRWISKGEEDFFIEEIDRKKRGTKIYFKFKEEYKEYANAAKIESIVKEYSNFVDFPIYINGKKVDTVKAIWQKSKDEIDEKELKEFYKFVSGDFQDPLGHIVLSIEGAVNFKAILFVPQSAPPSIFQDFLDKSARLYSNKILIQENCKDLLPDYLRFVRGAVDTEDLPLNVSRETIQKSPKIAKIRKILTDKILGLLKEWLEKEPEKYDKFFKEFGFILKAGLSSDFANKEKLLELVKYETSELPKGKTKTLKEYVKTMPEDQKEIYFAIGDNRDLIEKNPQLEYFKDKGFEVILLYDPADVFTFPYIGEFEGKPIVSIEKAKIDDSDLAKPDKEKLSDAETKELTEFVKSVLGDKVEKVSASKRLTRSPAAIVSSEKGLDKHMEKALSYLDKNFQESKKVLEINPSHPLIINLGRAIKNKENKESELIKKIAYALYENAKLTDGKLDDPISFIEANYEIMSEVVKAKV